MNRLPNMVNLTGSKEEPPGLHPQPYHYMYMPRLIMDMAHLMGPMLGVLARIGTRGCPEANAQKWHLVMWPRDAQVGGSSVHHPAARPILAAWTPRRTPRRTPRALECPFFKGGHLPTWALKTSLQVCDGSTPMHASQHSVTLIGWLKYVHASS